MFNELEFHGTSHGQHRDLGHVFRREVLLDEEGSCLRRGISGEPFDFEPPSPFKIMHLITRKFLGIARSTGAIATQAPGCIASRLPAVSEASLALVLASKAAQPMKTFRFFGR